MSSTESQHIRTIIDQHNRQAEGYARLTESLGTTDRSALLRARIGAGAADEVLDVACGPGRLTLELAPHVAAIIGLDLTPGMLEQAHDACRRGGHANARFVRGDASAMPFPDGTFSLVISSAAFHHFESPAAVLAEMIRVCRGGGRIVISDVTPAEGKTSEYDRIERLRDPSHGHAHSVGELVRIGARLGLAPPAVYTSLSGPMAYSAVLATSFPEATTRENLMEIMRQDAAEGEDRMGFRAELGDGEVLVSYPMSQMVWEKH